ncbi:MAG TPA: hypothetical protein GXX75_16975 [Clostridiales bacterium]|nr:hypothetical protein [Clostridiales bacterium]
MKEHTHLHPYLGTSVPSLGYYYYDTLLQDLYIKEKIFHNGNSYGSML